MAQAYVAGRQAFGSALKDRESVQMLLAEAAQGHPGRATAHHACRLAARPRRQGASGRSPWRRCTSPIPCTGPPTLPSSSRAPGAIPRTRVARVDLPLCAGGAAGRRRVGSAHDAHRPAPWRARRPISGAGAHPRTPRASPDNDAAASVAGTPQRNPNRSTQDSAKRESGADIERGHFGQPVSKSGD